MKKIPAIIRIIICIILVPILVMNIAIIVKSYTNPEEVPDFFGIKPLIVITGSMEGTIDAGDVIDFLKTPFGVLAPIAALLLMIRLPELIERLKTC